MNGLHCPNTGSAPLGGVQLAQTSDPDRASSRRGAAVRPRSVGVLAFVAAAQVAAPVGARAMPLDLRTFGELALRCGPAVAPSTLAAVAEAESRLQPLAINDNSLATTAIPATRDIAAQVATRLIAAGHSVDLGLMQINSANLAKVGLTPDTAFDPCASITAAAAILVGDYGGGDTHDAQQAQLRAALSDYNTGDPLRGFENGYVHKVELAAREVVPALDVAASAGDTVGAPRAPSAVPSGAQVVDTTARWDVWASSADTSALFSGRDAASSQADAASGLLPDADAPQSASVNEDLPPNRR